MKKLKKLSSLYLFLLFFIFYFSSIFDRSFVGLNIFGFRLGELVVLLMFLQSVLIIFFNKKIKAFLKIEIFSTPILLFKLILTTFVISLIYHNTNFLSAYTYKTSSYIWMCSLFFATYFLFKNHFLDIQHIKNIRRIVLTFSAIPFVHYLFSSGYYPNFIIDFFNNHSDKFNFTKASDIMIVLVMANLLFFNFFKKTRLAFIYFSMTVPLLLPLLLEMSRGSFLGALSFLFLVIIYNLRFFIKNPMFSILIFAISSIFFIASTYRISGIEFNLSQRDSIVVDTSISGNIAKIAAKKDTRKAFFSFYIQDGRLVSDDNTTNWRLDIWQDVIEDLTDKNSLTQGYGYNSIIPVMTDPTAPGRLGRDGLNENVHSYIFNIIARGGVYQLILFFFFHLSIVLIWRKRYNNLDILLFMIPVFINSFTDMNMEGVQFPFLYYFFLGLYFKIYEHKNDLINHSY